MYASPSIRLSFDLPFGTRFLKRRLSGTGYGGGSHSVNLAELSTNLQRALRSLPEDEEDSESAYSDFGERPEDKYRPEIDRCIAYGWKATAEGDFDAIRDVVDILRDARPLVDGSLPDLSPRAGAAVEIQSLLSALSLGEQVLRQVGLEVRLADRKSSSLERAVLQTLLGSDQYMRRGEVHKQLALPKGAERPTPHRIGQVLEELHDQALLLCRFQTARGNPRTRFYALSPRGRALCDRLGLVALEPEPGAGLLISRSPGLTIASQPLVEQLLNKILDPYTPDHDRRVALGFISNVAPDDLPLGHIKELLRDKPSEQDHAIQALLRAVEASRKLDGIGLSPEGWTRLALDDTKIRLESGLQQAFQPDVLNIFSSRRARSETLIPPEFWKRSVKERCSLFDEIPNTEGTYGFALFDGKRVKWAGEVYRPRMKAPDVLVMGNLFASLYTDSKNLVRQL